MSRAATISTRLRTRPTSPTIQHSGSTVAGSWKTCGCSTRQELSIHRRAQLSQPSVALLRAAGADRPQARRPSRARSWFTGCSMWRLPSSGSQRCWRLDWSAGLSRITFYAYVVPLACIPVLAPLAGSVNNDNAAFAGGAIAMLGAWQLDRDRQPRLVVGGARAVSVVASWAKLTGLMLVGGMLGGVAAVAVVARTFAGADGWCRSRLPRCSPSAPYIAFVAQYGNPAPNTAGQIAMSADECTRRRLGCRARGCRQFPMRCFSL